MKHEINEPTDILDIAKEITSTDRQEQHGPPERSLGNIASLWTAYLRARFPDAHIILRNEDTALMMNLLKTGRSATKLSEGLSVPRDNWIDIAGYARLGDLVSK